MSRRLAWLCSSIQSACAVTVSTPGRCSIELTRQVQAVVRDSGIDEGSCELFIHHTSASLMLCENADPEVRADLARFMARLVPDGDPLFQHIDEGPDDMPAHVRTLLTDSALSIPVTAGTSCHLAW